MKSKACFLLALALIIPAGASAVEADLNVTASVGIGMSEKDAIDSALRHSRELRRLEKRAEAKKLRIDGARFDVRNPEVRLSDISTKYAQDKNNDQLQVGLRWRPPKLGELNEKTQFARSEYCDANVDFFNYRAKLVGQVRMAWHGQALLADQLKLALRREEIEARRLDVVTRLVNIGQVSFVKKVKAQTGVLKARRDVASARQELESGRSRLMALAGVDVPVEVAASVLPINPVGFEQIMKVAWESRPEVEAAAQRAALAQSRYRAEKMKLIPWLSFVEVAYHYEREKTDWGELMFGIELPIFNWAGKQAKAAAVASESRKSAGAAGIEAIEQDIRDAYSKWDSARAALELLMSQTDETRANVRQMMSEARRQAMPEDEILELELSDVELEDMLLDARRDYAEACIDLCVAAGVDNFNGLSGN